MKNILMALLVINSVSAFAAPTDFIPPLSNPIKTPIVEPAVLTPQPEPVNSVGTASSTLSVVKTGEFTSHIDSYCNDFLCLLWELQGNIAASGDKDDPIFHIQNFSYKMGNSVLLECVRRYSIFSMDEISHVRCQLSADPALSTNDVKIELLDTTPNKMISIIITNKSILQELASATHNLLMAQDEEEVLVFGKNGQSQKVQRLSLSCPTKNLNPLYCKIIGVLN